MSDHDAASEPTASPAGVNMTSTLTLPGLQEPFRPRASSAHLRQLSNLIIPSGRLQLVETLGQGDHTCTAALQYSELTIHQNVQLIAAI